MIKSIKIINYLNESIEFELSQPNKSGFYIQEITGLGPPKANINITEVATNDGALFNSARVASRNVVLTLGFLFKPDVETIRQLSYKYFPIKKSVKMVVVTTNRVGEIFGYVESNEPNIFSNQQTTQISIICPDPFIYEENVNVTFFSGITPKFEFPFSNNSLTKSLLIMGEMHSMGTKSIYYTGDAEVGVIMHIYAHGPISNVKIYSPETDKKMEISDEKLISITGSSLIEGDRIVISTVKGDKFITLIRNGIEHNVLNALNRDAYWFQLAKGDNIFSYSSEFGLANLDFRIENRIVYEGV